MIIIKKTNSSFLVEHDSFFVELAFSAKQAFRSDPSEQLRSLQSEISKLKTELKQTNIELNSSQKFNELLAKYKNIIKHLSTSIFSIQYSKYIKL